MCKAVNPKSAADNDSPPVGYELSNCTLFIVNLLGVPP